MKAILLKLLILLFTPWAWYNYEFRWKKQPDTFKTRTWYSFGIEPIRNGEFYNKCLCKWQGKEYKKNKNVFDKEKWIKLRK